MAFNGACQIQSVGINSDESTVHFTLKALDGSFDWNPFRAKPEHNREVLAIALAAIASGKNVHIQSQDTTQWAFVSWFDIVK